MLLIFNKILFSAINILDTHIYSKIHIWNCEMYVRYVYQCIK